MVVVPDGERLAVLENEVSGIKDDIGHMRGQVGEIYDRLGQRPSWAVALALSTLSALVVGLAVALATSGGS